MTPETALRDLDRALAGEKVTFTYPGIIDQRFNFISGFIYRLFARHDMAFLSEIMLVVLKEIISNCSKANAKRMFFAEQKLDIRNSEDYERGMRRFSSEVLADWDNYLKKGERNKDYFIRVHIEAQPAEAVERIVFTVENSSVILSNEWERIKVKIQKYRKYRDINRAFAEIRDESEGAGLGIFLLLSLLENAGVPFENYQLGNQGGAAVNRITVPIPLARDEVRKGFYQKVLAEIDELPSFPENIRKLIDLCESETASVQNIASNIQKDPALTAHILKIVHSAGYLRYNRNPGLEEAVKVIGLKVIRNLLMATGARNVINRKYRIKDLEAIWEDSNRVSFFARRLAKKKAPQQADLVTVAGLLFELGRIVLVSLKPELVETASALIGQGRIRTTGVLEESQLGISHPEIGAYMGERWHFPDPLISAIRYQQRPLEAPEDVREAVRIIYMAVCINMASLEQSGYYAVEPEILEYFGLNDETGFNKTVKDFEADYSASGAPH